LALLSHCEILPENKKIKEKKKEKMRMMMMMMTDIQTDKRR